MSRHHYRICFLLVSFVLVPSLASSAEIEGKVAKVDGQTITISSPSDLLPAVGDKLRVFVEIPGVGKASVASATVSSIDDEVIKAKIDKSTGTVKPGQVVTITSAKPTKRTKPRDEMQEWGTPIDPSGDCSFKAANGKLTITVGEGFHDLWPTASVPENQRFNAPRVMQEVEGDFVAQVKVTADWKPYKSDTNYGAGLFVWHSETEFLRWERHVFIRDGKPRCFPNPMCITNKQWISGRTKTSADEFFKGRATWLRLERSGNKMTSAISHDGKEWKTTSTLETSFPKSIQLGVHAFKVSPGIFNAEFEDLTITRE